MSFGSTCINFGKASLGFVEPEFLYALIVRIIQVAEQRAQNIRSIPAVQGEKVTLDLCDSLCHKMSSGNAKIIAQRNFAR
jgi:hypothetical protein